MKRLIAIAFTFFCAAIAAAVSGGVYAQESDMFTLPPEYVAQTPISNAAHAIQDIVHQQNLAGYGGIRLDNENNAVLLHWKGQVPNAVSNFLASSDVTITIISVPYSEAELLAEIERIIQTPKVGDVYINNIGISRTFNSIEIGVDTGEDQPDAEKIAAGRAAFTSTFPLEFSVSEPATPFRDRWDDEEPFYGGAAIDHRTQLIPISDNETRKRLAVVECFAYAILQLMELEDSR